MGSISITIQYAKNQYQIVSASELKTIFFSNIPLVDSAGNQITDEQIDFWIQSSQKELEDILDVKFNKQAYSETREYGYDDWIQWGFVPTTYPVSKGVSLKGFLNSTLQVDYPQEWLSVKTSSDKEQYYRSINLVPITGGVNQLTNNVVFSGVAPYIGYFGRKIVPNYWTLEYITGFEKIPETIMKAVGLKASINLLPTVSLNVVKPGIASQSLGIDGLSQSRSSTASAQKLALGNMIDAYEAQLKPLMDILNKKYQRVSFGVLG